MNKSSINIFILSVIKTEHFKFHQIYTYRASSLLFFVYVVEFVFKDNLFLKDETSVSHI